MAKRDPDAGRYTHRSLFRAEYEAARERLAPLGGEVTPGFNDYEAFVYNGAGLHLIFYPHKTSSTGNRHIRVRTQGKFDRRKLREALFALAENSCTFQCPAHFELHREAVTAAIARQHEAMAKKHRATPIDGGSDGR